MVKWCIKKPPPFNFPTGPPFPKPTTVYIAYILHLLTFVTNPPTLTVIYNSNFTIPYTKSWLLLEPGTAESTPTLKNNQKVNLMMISQRKRCSQWFPCKILFFISKTGMPLSTQLTFSGFTTILYIKDVLEKINISVTFRSTRELKIIEI